MFWKTQRESCLSNPVVLGGLGLRRWMFAAASLVITPTQSVGAQEAPGAATDSAVVEIRVDGRPLRKATIESGEIVIDTIAWRVRSGDNVKALLKAHGVVPDGAALARFYELNPGVRHADLIPVGSTIHLPRLATIDSVLLVSSERLTYAMLTDTTYRIELERRARRITQASGQLRQSVAAPLDARAFEAAAHDLEAAVRMLSRSSIPLPATSAGELATSMDALIRNIEDVVASGAQAPDALFQRMSYISAEVTAFAAVASTGANPRIEVDVIVLDTERQSVGSVRIRYVRPLYEHVSRQWASFVKPSAANAKHPFDLGLWVMWVEDLVGSEISVSRERVSITNPSQPVRLVVKRR